MLHISKPGLAMDFPDEPKNGPLESDRHQPKLDTP